MALQIMVETKRQYFQFVDKFLQKCSKVEKVAITPEWKQRHFTLAGSNYSHWNLGIPPPSTMGETYSFRHLWSHAWAGCWCLFNSTENSNSLNVMLGLWQRKKEEELNCWYYFLYCKFVALKHHQLILHSPCVIYLTVMLQGFVLGHRGENSTEQYSLFRWL